MMKCLLATRNKGKLNEIEQVLSDLDIQLVSLEGLGILQEAPEEAPDFTGNARSKAFFYHELSGLPTIADDSGLVVDALGGKPGVFSARYAQTDVERIGRVLRELESVGALDRAARTARFVCAVCMIIPDHEPIEVEGKVEGEITKTPRGEGGFGYDPIFYFPPFHKTFAELSRARKNDVSHRGHALQSLRSRLEGFKDI